MPAMTGTFGATLLTRRSAVGRYGSVAVVLFGAGSTPLSGVVVETVAVFESDPSWSAATSASTMIVTGAAGRRVRCEIAQRTRQRARGTTCTILPS